MTAPWPTKSLAEACEIRPRKSEVRGRLSDKDLVSFVPMEDLGIDQKFLAASKCRPLSEVIGGYTYFADGDVLLAKITPCFENGKLGIASQLENAVGFGSSEYIVLRPSPQLDAQWLYYFLSRESFRSEGEARMGGAVGHKRVAKEFIEGYRIPTPPVREQRRIVAILDEAFAGIAATQANTKKNLQNARALFESHLQSVFVRRAGAWEQMLLTDLCESSRVITYGVVKLGDEVPGGVPCLRTSNVRWLRIETGGIKHIAPKLSAEYSRTVLRGGEVLVNVRGTLGGVAVALPEMAGWNVSREVAVVPIDQTRVDPYFLSYLIGSGASQELLGGMKKGAAYIGINIEDLRLLPVGLPGLTEQKEVVCALKAVHDQTQRLESLYQRKLVALDALKQSLLHHAFSGQL